MKCRASSRHIWALCGSALLTAQRNFVACAARVRPSIGWYLAYAHGGDQFGGPPDRELTERLLGRAKLSSPFCCSRRLAKDGSHRRAEPDAGRRRLRALLNRLSISFHPTNHSTGTPESRDTKALGHGPGRGFRH